MACTTPTCTISNCPKPDYATFLNDYLSYAQSAANATGIPVVTVLSQWYQEWGIPSNNPGNLINATEGYCSSGTCSNGVVLFCTLQDGVDAWIANIQNLYSGGELTDVFGLSVNVPEAYQAGFPGGKTAANVLDDDGTSQTADSVEYTGTNSITSTSTEEEIIAYRKDGSYATMEALGASPWDKGHYFLQGQSMPGQELVNIANASGWIDTYYEP